MQDPGLKSTLMDICRKKILDSVATLEVAMADLQQQSNDYGAPKDRYDSFRTQLLRRKDMLAQQLAKELHELSTLNKVDVHKLLPSVQFGSVIRTGEETYFICVGLGKVETPYYTFFAISPMVPLSQALLGRKKGDTVDFRGRKLTLVEIL